MEEGDVISQTDREDLQVQAVISAAEFQIGRTQVKQWLHFLMICLVRL